MGAITSFIGTIAPNGWLMCDNTVYNKSDYEALWNVLPSVFKNTINNTFTIDLRGEFLRGAGTNSHTSQGNGASVGEHQAATVIPRIDAYHGDTSTPLLSIGSGTSGTSTTSIRNYDSREIVQNIWTNNITGTKEQIGGTTYDDYWAMMTTRPTNTSVNYIIKW